ncbi:MAG: hypothetical protein HY833_03240 [Candidatus Aenigmarchaeota archaeon]|nr:hypothetical protein [Candidatus Aenigmarchaeota archaeon]
MRQMKSTALMMGLLATLVLTSSAVLAVNVDVEVDKRIVAPGDSITISGIVTDEDGNPGVYDYRAAAIVAKHRNGGERIVICDSEKQTTAEDGVVSFECKIPTIEELEALGVDNAAERQVIPIKGGIAVRDLEDNKSKRFHGKALIVNTDKLKERLNASLEKLDNFISRAEEAMERCDNITARAEEAGAEHIIERCGHFQERLQEGIDKAMSAKERINGALDNIGNLSSFDFDNLGGVLHEFREGSGKFKSEVSDIRGFLEKTRGDLEKRVTSEVREKAIQKANEIREKALEKRAEMERKMMEFDKKRIGINRSSDDLGDVRHPIRGVTNTMPVLGNEGENVDEMVVSENNSDSDDDNSTEGTSGSSG